VVDAGGGARRSGSRDQPNQAGRRNVTGTNRGGETACAVLARTAPDAIPRTGYQTHSWSNVFGKVRTVAFSVRLIGWAERSGESLFRMEPPWWPVRTLKDDPRLQESVTDGYLDYRATLSAAEVRVLHERFRPEAVRGVFAANAWQEIIQPMLAELDAVLGSRSAEFGKFELCVFEWESGLESP
jgi:hypothetical protein